MAEAEAEVRWVWLGSVRMRWGGGEAGVGGGEGEGGAVWVGEDGAEAEDGGLGEGEVGGEEPAGGHDGGRWREMGVWLSARGWVGLWLDGWVEGMWMCLSTRSCPAVCHVVGLSCCRVVDFRGLRLKRMVEFEASRRGSGGPTWPCHHYGLGESCLVIFLFFFGNYATRKADPQANQGN